MANCHYCNYTLPNNKAVAIKCNNCNSVWCSNENCTGTVGRPQYSRNNGATCVACQKPNSIIRI